MAAARLQAAWSPEQVRQVACLAARRFRSQARQAILRRALKPSLALRLDDRQRRAGQVNDS
jgi:hypothetical protein